MHGVEERLEPRKVPDQFEDSEDPHDADQPDDLAGLADDLDVLQLVQEQRQVEGYDGEQVNLNRSPSSELIFHNSVIIVCCDHVVQTLLNNSQSFTIFLTLNILQNF